MSKYCDYVALFIEKVAEEEDVISNILETAKDTMDKDDLLRIGILPIQHADFRFGGYRINILKDIIEDVVEEMCGWDDLLDMDTQMEIYLTFVLKNLSSILD